MLCCQANASARDELTHVGAHWGKLERTHRLEVEAMLDLGMSEAQVAAYYGVDATSIRHFRAATVAIH